MPSHTSPIQRLVAPVQQFIRHQKSGGIVLGLSVVVALVMANTSLAPLYFHVLEYPLGLYVNNRPLLEYDLQHWINDGLMALFFFVVGLELKREIVAGELAEPRKAALPIVAALGGMIVPALIYLSLNPSGEVHSGWGIPMATDIAFSLGVLYLLGDRVPLSLKVFLTALAIVDDLGAVLVIAFFYTSDISIINLLTGLGFALLMYLGNRMGVRSILFYAFIGIFGVWTAFLLSGVHATIAAVLAAFTIPAGVRLREDEYITRIQKHLGLFKAADRNDAVPALTGEQLHVLETVKRDTNRAIPPLQQLEHALHPLVTFVVLPVFALANAGVSLSLDPTQLFSTNIASGVALGLLVGKATGVTGFTWLAVKLRLGAFPSGMNLRNLFGIGLLAAIGFTMSLFVTTLAFTEPAYMSQAKIGIFAASVTGGISGYLVLGRNPKKGK